MKKATEKRVLIVDDESEMRIALEATLQREGYQIALSENGRAALNRLQNETFDLVLTDMRMPEMGGLELLRSIKKRFPKTHVVMMTAYGTIDSAVESMKEGAFDYLMKPFSADIVASTLKRAFIRSCDTPSQAASAQEATRSNFPERKIVTHDPGMKKLLKFVENVAYSKSTVLISGESGTGKEMFSRYIHQCSPRMGKAFVAVNCAALPEGLLETELFGHEKGAFTGAATRKEGKFELADKGTLLLDEITEMSLQLQAKLLRVLQEHEVDRVGGKEPMPVDVRVIATTNRDIKQKIKENEFREDLYYRLNVIPLKLPSLRDRKDDISHLADFFLQKYGQENNKTITQIAPETVTLLRKYSWQGNVRELENTIERAVLLCQGETLMPSDLFMEEEDETDSQAGVGKFVGNTLGEMEKQLILQTLKDVDNNKTRCAEILDISVRTLRNKLAEYNSSEKE
ncbi:MAG: sigma-54 dependent transcriptional regulator [Nitrospinota bacterium]|nr:sigma-54 dependent transcriptional regulator [Nitrospinota bacterium]